MNARMVPDYKMVRPPDKELDHRLILRKKYFEDPNYRRWSDIISGGVDDYYYKAWRDDVLFDYFITNQVSNTSNAKKLVSYLDKGHELPINWSNFYAYFDERLNDPKNRYLTTITYNHIRGGDDEPETSVQELLNRYRDYLVTNYDMI